MANNATNLWSLTVGELRKTAQAAGVPAEQIEDARDGRSPKDSLIELIEARRKELEASAVAKAEGGISDLWSLTVGELRKTAQAAGVPAEQIEDARDGRSPKDSLIELIELPKERSDAPQLRATAASSVQPQPPTESDGGTKAMQLIRGVAARAIEYIYRPRAAGARAMHYYIDLVSTYPTFRPKYNRPGVN